MAMFVRHSDLTICIRLNFRLQKLNIELKSLRGVATGIAPSMAPNVYAQLNAAVEQALPYEGMAREVEYIKCMDHLPRRRKESVEHLRSAGHFIFNLWPIFFWGYN